MQPLSLSDFTANAQANLAAARDSQPSDPSIQYTGVVPTTSPHLGVEADYPLSKEFEGGLSVGILPMGTASDDISDGSGDSLTDSYQITAASIGVVGRFFVLDGDFKPWVAAGPLVVPVNVDYKYDYEVPSFSYSVSFAGPFNGFGLGVQAQLGIDIQVFDSVSFSVFGGYLVASANNLQGTLGQVSNIPNVTTGSGVELDVVPTPEGNVIVPVSNGYLCVPTYGYNAGDKAPSGTRPAVVDMSGPLAGISVDIYW
jgi:hypothetical protein